MHGLPRPRCKTVVARFFLGWSPAASYSSLSSYRTALLGIEEDLQEVAGRWVSRTPPYGFPGESVISMLDSIWYRVLLHPGLVQKLAKSTVAFGRRLEAEFTPGLQSVLISPPSLRRPTKGEGN
jgi:hypothetical protein